MYVEFIVCKSISLERSICAKLLGISPQN